jgi:cell division protein FtsZ
MTKPDPHEHDKTTQTSTRSTMKFELPTELSSIIKVIGVGGGGSNAVNHMHAQGINGVDFIICNTDKQALDISRIPVKLQIGTALTEGLGAGSVPERGGLAAQENLDEIRQLLSTRRHGRWHRHRRSPGDRAHRT